jgi:hypothetical protein
MLLLRMMYAVLAQMSVISEQRGRSYDGVSVHGGDKDRVPHLDEKPMVDYYRGRWDGCTSYAGRRQVVLDAVAALKLARKMQLPAGQPPTPDNPLWKGWVAESTLPTAELVRLFGMNRAYIKRIRADYGRGD